MSKKPTILVTGAGGQLGRELQELAPSYTLFNFVFLSRDDLPLQNFELLRNSLAVHQPDYLINCAAYTAVDKAEAEPELAFQVNAEAVGVMAAACRERDCRFIHISTDYVFDGTASSPYRENAFTNPQGVYGASKLAGERQALQLNEDSIIIRTSWVYSSYGKNFVKTMLTLMKDRDEIRVVGDQVGSPTYAADLAEALLQIIQQLQEASNKENKKGIYHFSNTGVISWYDFAAAIKELTHSHCKVKPITTAEYPTPAKRPAYSVLDKSRIQEEFGIVLKDWKESLASCLREM